MNGEEASLTTQPGLSASGSAVKAMAAVRQAAAAGRVTEAARLAVAAARSAHVQGFSRFALELLNELEKLVPASSLPPSNRAELLLQKGLAQVWQGVLAEAQETFNDVLSIDEVADDPKLYAGALRGLGLHSHFQGDYVRAREFYEQAAARASEANDAETTLKLRVDLVSLALEEGELDRAEKLLGELEAGPIPAVPAEARLSLLGIRAEIATENYELSEAERLFRKILRATRRSKTIGWEVRAMRGLGQLRVQQGKPGVAIRWFRNALRRTQLLGVFPEEIGIRISFALALQELDRLSEAVEQLEIASALAVQINNRDGLARAKAILGRLHFELGSLESAETLLQQARDLFIDLGNRSLVIRTLESLAETQAARGDSVDAIRTLEFALEQSADRSEIDRIALLHTAGAILLATSETRDRAVPYFERAVAAAEHLGDPNAILREAYSAGVAFAAVGSASKSIPFFERGLKAAEQLGTEQMVFHVRIGRGISLATEGHFSEAEVDFAVSLDLANRAEDRAMAAIAQTNLGVLERQRGNSEAAVRHLQLALSFARDLGNELLEAEVFLHSAENYRAMQRWSEAEEYFRQAGRLSYDFNIVETDMRAAAGLASLAYISGHYLDAIKFYDRASVLGTASASPRQLGSYLIGLAQSLLAARRERSLAKAIRRIVRAALNARSTALTSLAFAMAGDWWLDQGRSEETAQFYAASILLSLDAGDRDEASAVTIFQGFVDTTASPVDKNLTEGKSAFYDKVLSFLETGNKKISDSLRTQFNIARSAA